MSRYLPQLKALGLRDEKWTPNFMAERAEVLLRLVYARLGDWLGLDWSENSPDEPVSAIEEEPEPDEDGDFDEEESLSA